MIFAARSLLVSLAFLVTAYCALSAAVTLAWKTVQALRPGFIRSARLLFTLRILAFAFSAASTVFFTLPSFWLMERSSLDEDGATFVTAGCGLTIVVAGIYRLVRAQKKTVRAVAQWTLNHNSCDQGETSDAARGSAMALRASAGAPALILFGIRKPRVMVSDVAAAVLTEPELRAAVRHELGHRRSWDNLKKALITATPFLGMSALENAWREAAELEADDAAVANRQDALDLAAALIKLSRVSNHAAEPALASGLLTGSAATVRRVQRLLRWHSPSPRLLTWPLVCFLLVFAAVVATHYCAALALTHRVTELLMP